MLERDVSILKSMLSKHLDDFEKFYRQILDRFNDSLAPTAPSE